MSFDLSSQSLRRAQWTARAPRMVLMVSCAVLCALGLRALTSPDPLQRSLVSSPGLPSDLRAQALAEAFARVYRSPASSDRRRQLRRLAPSVFEDAGDIGGPGISLGEIRWSSVLEDRAVTGGGHRVTVLLQTVSALTALVVPTSSDASGVSIAGPPAIVGLPPAAPDVDPLGVEPVSDPALEATVARSLRNYLGRRRDDLAADLLGGAVVVVPDQRLRLVSIDEITWTSPGRVVRALLRANVDGGSEVRLGYELGVVRNAGRWFVSWIGAPTKTHGRS